MSQNPRSQSFQLWVKIFIPIAIIILALVGFFALRGEGSIVRIAEEHLHALRSNDTMRAYYDYTSQSYRKKTPLSNFKKFVKSNPALSSNTDISFYDSYINEDKGRVTVALQSNDGSLVPASFSFQKENGEWKISEIEILNFGAMRVNGLPRHIAFADEDKQPIEENMRVLIVPVENQLQELRAHDIQKAYDEYTSSEFRQATPYDAFVDFVKNFPELTDHKAVTFEEAKIEDGKGLVSTTLVTEQASYPIEYVLVEQDGTWKVWGFRIMPPLGSSVPTTPEEKEKIINVVRGQLNALKNDNVYDAYNSYASKEFQEATDFNNYMKFIERYPELTEFDSYRFGDSTVQNGLRSIKVFLKVGNEESELDFWLVKDDETDEWKIWGEKVITSVTYPPISDKERGELKQVIEDQLSALRIQDFSKAYYSYTSEAFENATSFDAFKKFVEDYPILMNYDRLEIGDGVKEGNLRLVRITLSNKEVVREIDFRFINEGGKWKVWGLQIIKEDAESEPNKNEKEAVNVIKKQIDSLKKEEFAKAYYSYNAPEFQKTASLRDFVAFVEAHPAIEKNQKLEVRDYAQNQGNVARVIAELSAPSAKSELLEYRLVQNNGKWKIMGIASLDSRAPKEDEKLYIDRAQIGTKIDAEGIIQNPSEPITADAERIYINFYLENGRSGDILSVSLEHMPTVSKLAPFDINISQDGASMATVILTPPANGWPLGDYEVKVTSPSGVHDLFKFTVLGDRSKSNAS